MFYPIIFHTWMARIFSSRLLFAVVLVLYSVPQSYLDWLLWQLTIGVYYWLLWIFGTFVQLCIVGFSPLWRLLGPLWYFAILVGGVLLEPTICSSMGSSCQRCLPPVLWALPGSVGIFNGTYSLCGWMTPFLYSRAVSIIGGQNHFPVGSCDVSVHWRDNDNVIFKQVLKNVLYFPDSPVKIISAHKLAAEWGSNVDLEGTSIKTKYAYSIFKWHFKEFQKIIQHPVHGLPEMVINDTDAGIFSTFCHFCARGASTSQVQFCSYAMNVGSQSLSLAPQSILRYSWDSFTSPCQILRVEDEDGVSPRIFIKLQCGRTLHKSLEHLQHLRDLDIASVPSKVDDFCKQVDSLLRED